MSEINLLPEQDRTRERQERAVSGRMTATERVELTSGSEFSKAGDRPRGHLLQRLFGRVPKDLTANAVVDRAVPQGNLSAPVPAGRSLWQRWFGGPKPPRPIIKKAPFPFVPSQPLDSPLGLAGSSGEASPIPHAAAPENPSAPSGDSKKTIVVEASSSAGIHSAPVSAKAGLSRWRAMLHLRRAGENENGKTPVTSLLPKEYVHASYHTLAYTQLILAFLVSSGIIALSFWLLLGYETVASAQYDQAKTSVATLNQEIAALDRDKTQALTLKRKMQAAAALLDAHVRWTRALAFVEATTVPDVQYLGLSVDASGRFSMKAVGASLSSFARQLTAFQNTPEVKFVSMSSAESQGDTGMVQFDVTLDVFPSVFDNHIKQ